MLRGFSQFRLGCDGQTSGGQDQGPRRCGGEAEDAEIWEKRGGPSRKALWSVSGRTNHAGKTICTHLIRATADRSSAFQMGLNRSPRAAQ
ncbi:hypothetical protein WA026_014656 [Henosepilachna vigintioctopunctata]|uniref:Uncharacterized protein n=1 Tax=Henosepilachna vigintioctopunctata TaxID=420089 RepID=A0AAW1VGS4_9CUCU